MTRLLGAHVGTSDPLAVAEVLEAGAVQVFLSNPQSWKKPKVRADTEALLASDVMLLVHAPYLVNVASANNRIRIPSRKILADTCEAAVAVGADAVVVHGGHVTDDEDVSEGFPRWRKALETLEWDIQILIENTAGGTNALSRDVGVIAWVLSRHLPRLVGRGGVLRSHRAGRSCHRADRPCPLQRLAR